MFVLSEAATRVVLKICQNSQKHTYLSLLNKAAASKFKKKKNKKQKAHISTHSTQISEYLLFLELFKGIDIKVQYLK